MVIGCAFQNERLIKRAIEHKVVLLDVDRQEIIKFGQLMKEVMSCLVAESEDPVTEGFLHERDIYRSLRDKKNVTELPAIDAISNMLLFLSSPLIGCVEHTKEGYYATGSLADAARKFTFYSRNCTEDM